MNTKNTPEIAEVWRPVEGWEKRYEVSNLGRVRSLKTGEQIAQFKNEAGYLYCCLNPSEGNCNKRVHRLVAYAFIPNHESKCCVHHRNHCRTDNRLQNLEWVTVQENNNMRRRTRRRKLNKQKADDMRRLYQQGEYNHFEIAEMFEVSPSHAHGILKCRIWVTDMCTTCT